MKKWGNIFLTGVLLFGGLASTVQAESAAESAGDQGEKTSIAAKIFKDMKGNWAEEVVEKWAVRGIVQGNEQDLFRPKGEITRAEWAAMINRVFQYEQMGHSTFTDVSESDWHSQEVAKGVQAGYIQGYTDGSFHPNGTLTRQEAAAV